MLREIRLAIMQQLIYWAVCVCPKDSHDTIMWFSSMPFDKGKKRDNTNSPNCSEIPNESQTNGDLVEDPATGITIFPKAAKSDSRPLPNSHGK